MGIIYKASQLFWFARFTNKTVNDWTGVYDILKNVKYYVFGRSGHVVKNFECQAMYFGCTL